MMDFVRQRPILTAFVTIVLLLVLASSFPVVPAVRCAPPANKPTPDERRACAPFLAREIEIVDPRVAVVLGAFGWAALLDTLRDLGWDVPRPAPRFGHGAEAVVHRGGRTLTLLGCFHVSQQNTFTGRLTPQMLDDVLRRAQVLARS